MSPNSCANWQFDPEWGMWVGSGSHFAFMNQPAAAQRCDPKLIAKSGLKCAIQSRLHTRRLYSELGDTGRFGHALVPDLHMRTRYRGMDGGAETEDRVLYAGLDAETNAGGSCFGGCVKMGVSNFGMCTR